MNIIKIKTANKKQKSQLFLILSRRIVVVALCIRRWLRLEISDLGSKGTTLSM